MVRNYSNLSAEEKNNLWKKCGIGDSEARAALIELNYGLVGSIAKRLCTEKEGCEELFQSGVMGLIECIDRYDIKKGASFASYAVPYIWGEMVRCIEKQKGQKHWEKGMLSFKKIQEIKDIFFAENLREPTYEELAEVLDVSTETVIAAMEENVFFSTDAEIADISAEKAFLSVENKIYIEELLDSISEKHRSIIQEHFFNAKTQQEISKKLQISQGRVSRLEREALLSLKKQTQW